MNNPKFIPVYRAITGIGRYQNGKFIHDGVPDNTARRYGAFASNSSLAQHISPAQRMMSEWDEALRIVKGLPVFLDQQEAVAWLEGRFYQNEPLLAQIQVPWEFLFGQNPRLILVQNGSLEKFDRRLTKEDITNHLEDTGKAIEAECFLGVEGKDRIPDELAKELREYEVLYRPSEFTEGRINSKKGFIRIMLDPEIQEGNPEISRS